MKILSFRVIAAFLSLLVAAEPGFSQLSSFSSGQINFKSALPSFTSQALLLSVTQVEKPIVKQGTLDAWKTVTTSGLSIMDELAVLRHVRGEIRKEMEVPGSGHLPEVVVISDQHGAIVKFDALVLDAMRSVLPEGTLPKEFSFKHDVSYQEQLSEHGVHLSDFLGKLFFHLIGDMIDRGHFGLQVFRHSRELYFAGLSDGIAGNHDFYGALAALGYHLPTYDGYDTYGYKDNDGSIDQLLKDRHKSDPHTRDQLWWANHLADFQEYQAKRQREHWSRFDVEVKSLYSTVSDSLKDYPDQQALWNQLRGWYNVNIYTGTRAVGSMSIQWWLELADNFEQAFPTVEDSQDPRITEAWARAIEMMRNDIIPELEGELKTHVDAGEWWWRVFEAINYGNYRTPEWYAKDWSFHAKWGPYVFAERSRELGSEINSRNFVQDDELKAFASFVKQTFNLDLRDIYQDGHLHSFLPVDPKTGEFYFTYQGVEYRGVGRTGKNGYPSVAQGMQLLRQEIRSKPFIDIHEAVSLVVSWYADTTTKSKASDILRALQGQEGKGGVPAFMKMNGYNRLFNGHVPLAMQHIRQLADAIFGLIFFTDLGMAEAYGDLGGAFHKSLNGIFVRGYERPGSTTIVDRPTFIIRSKLPGREPLSIPNPGVPPEEYLPQLLGQVESRIAELERDLAWPIFRFGMANEFYPKDSIPPSDIHLDIDYSQQGKPALAVRLEEGPGLHAQHGVRMYSGNVILGFANFDYHSNQLWLEWINVAEQARKYGVGLVLMNWLFARAREKGYSQLSLKTNDQYPGIRKFYEKISHLLNVPIEIKESLQIVDEDREDSDVLWYFVTYLLDKTAMAKGDATSIETWRRGWKVISWWTGALFVILAVIENAAHTLMGHALIPHEIVFAPVVGLGVMLLLRAAIPAILRIGAHYAAQSEPQKPARLFGFTKLSVLKLEKQNDLKSTPLIAARGRTLLVHPYLAALLDARTPIILRLMTQWILIFLVVPVHEVLHSIGVRSEGRTYFFAQFLVPVIGYTAASGLIHLFGIQIAWLPAIFLSLVLTVNGLASWIWSRLPVRIYLFQKRLALHKKNPSFFTLEGLLDTLTNDPSLLFWVNSQSRKEFPDELARLLDRMNRTSFLFADIERHPIVHGQKSSKSYRRIQRFDPIDGNWVVEFQLMHAHYHGSGPIIGEMRFYYSPSEKTLTINNANFSPDHRDEGLSAGVLESICKTLQEQKSFAHLQIKLQEENTLGALYDALPDDARWKVESGGIFLKAKDLISERRSAARIISENANEPLSEREIARGNTAFLAEHLSLAMVAPTLDATPAERHAYEQRKLKLETAIEETRLGKAITNAGFRGLRLIIQEEDGEMWADAYVPEVSDDRHQSNIEEKNVPPWLRERWGVRPWDARDMVRYPESAAEVAEEKRIQDVELRFVVGFEKLYPGKAPHFLMLEISRALRMKLVDEPMLNQFLNQLEAKSKQYDARSIVAQFQTYQKLHHPMDLTPLLEGRTPSQSYWARELMNVNGFTETDISNWLARREGLMAPSKQPKGKYEKQKSPFDIAGDILSGLSPTFEADIFVSLRLMGLFGPPERRIFHHALTSLIEQNTFDRKNWESYAPHFFSEIDESYSPEIDEPFFSQVSLFSILKKHFFNQASAAGIKQKILDRGSWKSFFFEVGEFLFPEVLEPKEQAEHTLDHRFTAYVRDVLRTPSLHLAALDMRYVQKHFQVWFLMQKEREIGTAA